MQKNPENRGEFLYLFSYLFYYKILNLIQNPTQDSNKNYCLEIECSGLDDSLFSNIFLSYYIEIKICKKKKRQLKTSCLRCENISINEKIFLYKLGGINAS